MKPKLLGIILLLTSLILATTIVSEFQIYEKVEDFAVLADSRNEVKIVDKIVEVPPFNRTQKEAFKLNKNWGWVGFNISLPHEGESGYEAYGVIVSANPQVKVDVVMAIVNETGLDLLIFDGFSEQAWNASKVYATASLDEKKQYQTFWLNGLDGAGNYCVLFRGRKNATDDMPVLISIKERWYAGRILIPKTVSSVSITATLFFTGLTLTLFSLSGDRKRSRKKPRLTR